MSLYFETGYGSLNKYGEELCGDKVEVVKKDGSTMLVLADGLGSGVKANILASLTSKIVSTMLTAGAEIGEVVETIAATLPVCSERQIAYSTFSFLQISPTGEARLVEYDNPEAVVLRKGKQLQLNKVETLYSDKRILESKFILEPEDTVLIFSDGVVNAGVGKLLNLGWQHKNVVQYVENAYKKEMSAYTLQSLLLSACDNLYMQSPGDDTTVAVVRARIPNPATVMVGPPVNREEDSALVTRFLNSDGTKIVCGGTTSQIVSRISGRPLTAELNYISPDIPPTGHIEGVDLVTEGVVTLGKTLEYIRRYENSTVGRENALNYGKDGAALLAQQLIEKSTSTHFLVGRALNPAHQNPDMPIDLSIKLRLVQEIAECLRQLGKTVTVEYH